MELKSAPAKVIKSSFAVSGEKQALLKVIHLMMKLASKPGQINHIPEVR